MITKKQAEKCKANNHTAVGYTCDCREYRMQEMESALRVISSLASDKWNEALSGRYVQSIMSAIAKRADEALKG